MAHILIIEDFQDNRELVELILQDAGHTAISAADARDGIRLAASEQPDLIIMDLALPHLDGWQATCCLKAEPATRHIPVLAFTAYLTPNYTTRALEAGCNAIVAKPFEIDELLDQIDELLQQHSQDTRQRAYGALAGT